MTDLLRGQVPGAARERIAKAPWLYCDNCFAPLNLEDRSAGRCRPCRAAAEMASGLTAEEALKRRRQEADPGVSLEAGAMQIDGGPWWESPRRLCVTAHADLEDVNAQAEIAGDVGWRITARAISDGHVNFGSTIIGYAVAGPLLAAAAAGNRDRPLILVSWERVARSA